ncbi:hypothetical protein BDD12DRAFT_81647 [Trichophaea hybrida]|nr:hypothetical protein BDD12DRAFT_81647 [Trichophaea hybrida]
MCGLWLPNCTPHDCVTAITGCKEDEPDMGTQSGLSCQVQLLQTHFFPTHSLDLPLYLSLALSRSHSFLKFPPPHLSSFAFNRLAHLPSIGQRRERRGTAKPKPETQPLPLPAAAAGHTRSLLLLRFFASLLIFLSWGTKYPYRIIFKFLERHLPISSIYITPWFRSGIGVPYLGR